MLGLAIGRLIGVTLFAIIDFYDKGRFTVDVVQIIDGKATVWGELIDGNK